RDLHNNEFDRMQRHHGIPALELFEFIRVVRKPLPQFGTRRDIFEPLVIIQIFLLDAAWPEPLHQELFAFGWRVFVHALDGNHSVSTNLISCILAGTYFSLMAAFASRSVFLPDIEAVSLSL